jgi:hypothetical protein
VSLIAIGGKFSASANDAGSKFATGVNKAASGPKKNKSKWLQGN